MTKIKSLFKKPNPNKELVEFLESKLAEAKEGSITKMAGFYQTSEGNMNFAFDLRKCEAVGWLLMAANELGSAERWMPTQPD